MVRILGEEYVVRGAASEEYLRELAAAVDSRAGKLLADNPRLGTTRCAVLTALTFADEYARLKEEHERLAAMFEEEWSRRKRKAD
jgi:cell division protein ZapA